MRGRQKPSAAFLRSFRTPSALERYETQRLQSQWRYWKPIAKLKAGHLTERTCAPFKSIPAGLSSPVAQIIGLMLRAYTARLASTKFWWDTRAWMQAKTATISTYGRLFTPPAERPSGRLFAAFGR